jgi:NADPH:quinone reductase-like Zn-dependent oxidoreductase
VLTPKGVLVIVGAETDGRIAGGTGRIILAPLLSMFVGQRLVPLVSGQPTVTLDALRELADSGALRPRIGQVWPLERAREAVAALRERRLNGRIVVSIPH